MTAQGERLLLAEVERLSAALDCIEEERDVLGAERDRLRAEELILRNANLRYQDHAHQQLKARDAQIERLQADNAALAQLLADRDQREDTLNQDIAALKAANDALRGMRDEAYKSVARFRERIDAAFALCDESTAQWGSDGHVVIKDTRVVRVVYETDLRDALTGED